MSDVFKKPVPFLSDNNVEVVCKKMEQGADYFVEYGMGCSTLYFINRFQRQNSIIVSVENTIGWFEQIVNQVKSGFGAQVSSETVSHLTLSETYTFIKGLDASSANVPEKFSRRRRWKESLLLGPFYRLAPDSKTRFSGTLPLWPLLRWPLMGLTFFLYAFVPRSRPTRGECKAQVGTLSIVLRNVPPALKDQFGESPTSDEYINAGLIEIKQALKDTTRPVKALFIIDGGPRGEIVRTVLKMEEAHPNFYPTIFLCEAHQAFYADLLQTRPSGTFLPGSNITMDGRVVQENPRSNDEATMLYMFGKITVSKEELAQREIWFYERTRAGVPA